MWKKIENEKDLLSFMESMGSFHDSCIKEIKYISGAYVNDDFSMYPLNDRRILKIIIQRQTPEMPMVEMEFSKLKFLQLCPIDESYTCEITESKMFIENGLIYWADCTSSSEAKKETIVCASNVKWRCIEGHMGSSDFYCSSL